MIGAGDLALPSLLETLASGGDAAAIPNVRLLRGGAVRGGKLEVVEDLGALPFPAFEQFELDRYLSAEPILPLQTARGCTWSRCAFCSHHTVFQSRYKAAGIDWVVEALKHLRQTHTVDHFALHDIELPPRRAEALADAILAEPELAGIAVSAYARLVGGYGVDRRLRRLADAGFSTFEWGLESGCERVLGSMKKGTHVATMERVLRHSAAAGISNQCFLLFGFPGETVEEAQATVEFVTRNKEYIDRIGLSLLAVYPGSDLHKDPGRWGIELAGDGTHKTAEGMKVEEAESFYRRLKIDYAMNPDKYSSDRINCLLQGSDSRMFHFLHRSHDVLPGDGVAALVAERGKEGVYPVVLGRIVADADRIRYAPVSAGESSLINLVRPPTPVEVDDLKRLVFHLADGRSSVAEILAAVETEAAGGGDGGDPVARTLAFLEDVFDRGWALAYGRRWA